MEQAQLSLAVNLQAIILDIVLLALYFPWYIYSICLFVLLGEGRGTGAALPGGQPAGNHPGYCTAGPLLS